MPPGFIDVSTEYMPGWTVKVMTAKLAKPVQTDDGEVTEEVRRSSGRAAARRARSRLGSSSTSRSRPRSPARQAKSLTFKMLQYYDNGEVVRWIGPPELRQNRHPQIDVTAAGGVLQDVAGTETAPPSPSAGAPAAGETSDQLRRQRQQGPRHRGARRRRPRPDRRRHRAGSLPATGGRWQGRLTVGPGKAGPQTVAPSSARFWGAGLENRMTPSSTWPWRSVRRSSG